MATTSKKIRRALISVYDKTGIVEFARALHDEFGVEIISTGGTAATLKEAGVPVTMVEDVTGFPEMMDGRVKTLHPKIHAGILADRDNPEHMRQLAEQGIEPIDLVVVNLYPFEKTIADPNCTFEQAIEMIDIGGPCLLRAAAKNHKHVLVCTLDRQQGVVLDLLRGAGEADWDEQRRRFARQAFRETMNYDAYITEWLSHFDAEGGRDRILRLLNANRLRYGENPHQVGEYLLVYGDPRGNALACAVGQAETEVSFNNYADASAALELCAELTRATVGRAKLCFASRGPAGAEDEERSGTPDETNQRFVLPGGDQPGRARLRRAPVRDEVRSRRKLPHWQIPGATYWITFTSSIGDLSGPEREVVMSALRHWDGTRLDLFAAVVLPDHVHALLAPREVPDRRGEFYNLSELLKSIKSFSGREISQLRGGVGQVWTRESFDRWIRTEADFEEKWRYIADNVVKEGLAATPDEYDWWFAVDVLGLGIGRPADAPQQPGAGVELDKAELCSPPDSSAGEGIPPVCTDKAELCSPRLREACAVCFIKHTNACGSAVDVDPVEAYRKAYLGDPNAAMGGILAVNFPVAAPFAEAVMDSLKRWGKDAGAGAFFVEVWLAPGFDEEAIEVIRTAKKWGQRVRLLNIAELNMDVEPDPEEMDLKRIAGGVLMQSRDVVGLNEDQWKVVTDRHPTESELDDLRLAWLVCKHTKSNAITICKDGMLIGNGAGQMSRVMSCRIASWLAKENGHADRLTGAVAASDAFFPFRDGPDILADAGVTAIIQPGGSKKDQQVIDACNERKIAMIFTGVRHFKH